MTIDIARDSFNPKRGWRAVLAQQGRVTLEADINEQAAIEAANLRAEIIDIIGPVGTPDQGYQISTAGPEIKISAGTIYVGGWRLTLPAAITAASQPGWLDMPPLPHAQGNEIIALLAIEQTVTAVEDTALREVALGGPDSAGRLVLLQHVLRIPSAAASCADAAADLPGILETQGLAYNPADCTLTSTMTLRVASVAGPAPAGPCDPPATGGYLGADNQMIRVSVTEVTATGGKLVWGWNNASFLFRATVAQSKILTLASDPLDPEHTPQAGKVVEILRATVNLGDGDQSKDGGGNFIAAGEGKIMILGPNPYAAATRQLTLPDDLGTAPSYLNDGKHPLFVRLWEQELDFFTGNATILGDTGLAVTITNPALPDIGGRPFWHFAVRPLTPEAVYPERYLHAPQPPDGPREFLATLGVVSGNGDGFRLIQDCSIPFLPLTKLHDGGCCSLVLDPAKNWVTTLSLAAGDPNVTALSVCFQPGTFTVTDKITIANKTVRMTGAGAGTQITGASLECVFEFDNCPAVNLADFCVAALAPGYSGGAQHLQGAVTISNCPQVDIERMTFTCGDADLRAASCLTVTNPALSANGVATSSNTRILNSQFNPGYFQVGILLVNADRAQVEGNLIINTPKPLNIPIDHLGSRLPIAWRLRKQLVHGMTLIDTAAISKRAKARLRKSEAAGKAASAATARATNTKAETLVKTRLAPKLDLGAFGRAHVKLNLGTIRLSFVSSDRLSNAWTDAFQAAGLTETSKVGAVHKAIRNIANNVVLKPETAAPAFRNWLIGVLPDLYSTSSQGIVIGGDMANDVRIMNNTINGMAQGIHVGLSDIKKFGKGSPHLLATRVQICGNTINIRVTAEVTKDRHGIYLGCAGSAVIEDNHLALTRYPNLRAAPAEIDAIKIAGFFGQLLMVARNNMLGFSTGIYTAQDASSPPAGVLWKISDNASDADNDITGNGMFIESDNMS